MRWIVIVMTVAAATGPAQIWLDDELAVSYSARIEGQWLVVEVNHEPGWHTYAMDNVLRAREKSGKERPDTELPTRITPLDGATIQGAWRQSPPRDLSVPEMRWYTWGFGERSYFAAPVDENRPPVAVQIDGQACTDELCAMIDALIVTVDSKTAAGGAAIDPMTLVVVARDDAEGR